jgi:hypothetical protein
MRKVYIFTDHARRTLAVMDARVFDGGITVDRYMQLVLQVNPHIRMIAAERVNMRPFNEPEPAR